MHTLLDDGTCISTRLEAGYREPGRHLTAAYTSAARSKDYLVHLVCTVAM